jgi:uncharacterized protein (TIGR02246 family)
MRTLGIQLTVGGIILACVLLAVRPVAGFPPTRESAGPPAATADPQARSSAGPQGATAVLSDRPDAEQAILAVDEAFRRVYNMGDSTSAAGFFTEDAEIIDEYGERVQGRAAIQDLFAAMFRERPGANIEFTPTSLRFLGPDVAKQEGQTRVKPTGTVEPTLVRRVTVLYIKRSDKWMFSSVREEHEPALTHHDRIKDLDWLTGEWVDESAVSTISATCRWSADSNYLLREFTIHVQGKPAMTVSQRIGWDPLTRQVKSWFFDSEGGYGDALWTRDGDKWVIKSTGVLPDGRLATATNVLSRLGPHSARWASTERTVGGQAIPEHEDVVFVRRPPRPQSQPPAGTPSPAR